MNFRQVKRLIEDYKIEFIDLKFTDLLGTLQHFTFPVEEFSEDMFTEGVGFDGSSIRGFQSIHESDMLLKADINTAFLDPFTKHPTLSFLCNVKDPITRELYSRDPRYVAMKAERFLMQSGIADTAYFGPEAEFFIFDDVRYEQTTNRGVYELDSSEGFWNTARKEEGNLAYKIRYKEGYVPAQPADSTHDLRAEMVKTLLKVGIRVEVHHHEVATAGQAEIDIRFDTLLKTADNMVKYKYVIRNVARKYGKTVTFMPKPIFGDNGSGMHVHQSLWKGGRNLFFNPEGYAGLSQIAIWYIGGILYHAHSLLAFCAPTTNSYKRLVPGYEAPVNLIYSKRNRSACIRIPMYSESEKAKRIEFRSPDPSSNPYLAFAAMLMAGIDGIINRIEPPPPVDRNLYELSPEELASIGSTPKSLEEAIDALERDYEYLLRGGVFTEDLIETWIEYKRKNEIDYVRLRPHPAEFVLYYDV